MNRIKTGFLLASSVLVTTMSTAQNNLPAGWRGHLVRKDGKEVIFIIEVSTKKGQPIFNIINAKEKITVNNIIFSGDSIFFEMPAFESSFRVKKQTDGSLRGTMTKGTSGDFQYWGFYAEPNQLQRFLPEKGTSKYNISGRWDVSITRANGTVRKAVAEFVQQKDKLTGTFLTPSGDYRYLDGIVTGDSLKLTAFDGSHIYLFTAKIDNDAAISGGSFYSGFSGTESWIAEKNAAVKTPVQDLPASLKENETRLNFTFNDIDGKPVSISDDRFKNKVVIVQILGSWCPNCLDETKFLSDYYNKNKHRGVEVVGLAYEYSTNLERSKKSIGKFQQLFNVQYPILITGVTASDEQKTEKTLPQLTPIRSFPTTIFIDKKGNVRKVKGDFYGPGAGKEYEAFKKEFFETVEKLMAGK